MSVKEELLRIADALKDATRERETCDFREQVIELAAELRGVAKAMPDAEELRKAADAVRHGGWDPHHEDAKIRARIAAQDARQAAAREEITATGMLEVVGGPAADTYVPVQGTPPDGGYCMISGGRYQFREGKLHYVPR